MKPALTLMRFGFRQVRRGALILGILTGFMIIVQGLGYVATYPDQASRAQFSRTLGSAPALGVLYGESKNTGSPEGYIVYRTVPFLGTIAAVWALLTTTRLLRGQEEDGRWEVLTSTRVIQRGATWSMLGGFGLAFIMAYSISTLATVAGNLSPDIHLSLGISAAINLAIFLPALLCASLGTFFSQLWSSRRRAVFWTLAVVVAFVVLRALGNTITDLYWLKKLTPFGWSDIASPVVDPQLQWLLLFVAFAAVFSAFGLYLAGKRDVGMGLLPESDHARSHFWLLRSPFGLALRQQAIAFTGWLVMALGVSGIIAAISKIAVDAVKDSASLKGAIHQLSSASGDIAVAFIGAGMTFTVMVLLVMIAVSVGSIRGDEAKTYLDTMLTQPVRRSSWLMQRLGLLVGVVVIILLATGLLSWWLADRQGIAIDLGNFLLVSLALTGTLIFTLGIGALFYGLWPRIAMIAVYVVIGWSFTIDLLRSVLKLDDWVVNSSLFHYVSLSPAAAPDWKTFCWLAALGMLMMALGIFWFTRRDVVAE